MGRNSLPEHEKLDVLSPLRVRAPVGQRAAWLEVAAELGLTETALARVSVLLMINAIANTNPALLARAVKRANTALIDAGYPPITVAELATGAGLPERMLITLTDDDEADYQADRARQPINQLFLTCLKKGDE